MFSSEYIKSMNCNFERIKLDEKPEERRYQYCILSRGGISGLLPCSLRVINGDAYLYYDITSKQGLGQMFRKKSIGRQWIKDFVWNLKKISRELNRFLLDASNVIWYPEKIFQDLEDNRWSFLYYPYYKGENGFRNLLEFIIEKIDYQDEKLVECVYKMYEQYDNYGDDYLAERIYSDVLMLDESDVAQTVESGKSAAIVEIEDEVIAKEIPSTESTADSECVSFTNRTAKYDAFDNDNTDIIEETVRETKVVGHTREKRGLLSFLEGSRKKDRDAREKVKRKNHYLLDSGEEYTVKSVAEENDFYKCSKQRSDIGKTVYIENVAEDKDDRRRLFDANGKMLCLLEQDSVVIGKKKDESDMVIENSTVSRVHARIFFSNGDYMLEDLNSTNGTFKNGLRLKPYEQRKLMQGDEIKLGSVALMYN